MAKFSQDTYCTFEKFTWQVLCSYIFARCIFRVWRCLFICLSPARFRSDLSELLRLTSVSFNLVGYKVNDAHILTRRVQTQRRFTQQNMFMINSTTVCARKIRVLAGLTRHKVLFKFSVFFKRYLCLTCKGKFVYRMNSILRKMPTCVSQTVYLFNNRLITLSDTAVVLCKSATVTKL